MTRPGPLRSSSGFVPWRAPLFLPQASSRPRMWDVKKVTKLVEWAFPRAQRRIDHYRIHLDSAGDLIEHRALVMMGVTVRERDHAEIADQLGAPARRDQLA